MKPEIQLQQPNREQLLVNGNSVERQANKINHEPDLELGSEQNEQIRDGGDSIANEMGIITSLPVPINDNNDSNNDDDITAIGSTPVIAKDDDLIEKEWVDKAKKIVADTRNNPHRREEAVNKLQTDYLKKRYGRELGVNE
jgi:hypothetical protein